MATKLAETAKQIGAAAFSQSLGKGTYDVLMDAQLSAQLAALWDCETLEDLCAYVIALPPKPKINAVDWQGHTAQRAFLRAAQAYVLVSNKASDPTACPLPSNEI